MSAVQLPDEKWLLWEQVLSDSSLAYANERAWVNDGLIYDVLSEK